MKSEWKQGGGEIGKARGKGRVVQEEEGGDREETVVNVCLG